MVSSGWPWYGHCLPSRTRKPVLAWCDPRPVRHKRGAAICILSVHATAQQTAEPTSATTSGRLVHPRSIPDTSPCQPGPCLAVGPEAGEELLGRRGGPSITCADLYAIADCTIAPSRHKAARSAVPSRLCNMKDRTVSHATAQHRVQPGKGALPGLRLQDQVNGHECSRAASGDRTVCHGRDLTRSRTEYGVQDGLQNGCRVVCTYIGMYVCSVPGTVSWLAARCVCAWSCCASQGSEGRRRRGSHPSGMSCIAREPSGPTGVSWSTSGATNQQDRDQQHHAFRKPSDRAPDVV